MKLSRVVCVVGAVSVLFAGGALAQNKATHPAPARPSKTADSQKSDLTKPTVKGENGYPDLIQKSLTDDLCAANDYRGKTMPNFKVESWITTKEAPKREGKTVLIDFWATWCGPCCKLIPELNEWQSKFKDDLVVIGISDEDTSKLSQFVKSTKMEYAMGTDQSKSMKKDLGVRAIPHVLVISSDGIVRWQGFPGAKSDSLTEAKLKQIIDADKAARAKKGKDGGTKDSTPAKTGPTASAGDKKK